jgi:hypothetical protein
LVCASARIVSANLLLHAITTRLEGRSSATRGLRGARLTPIANADLESWASELTADIRYFSREDMLEHHRIVTGVFRTVEACLPVRFPTRLDQAHFATLVAERRTDLQRQLEMVSGACELAITAVWATVDEPSPTPTEASPGRRYLLERQWALSVSEGRRARALEVAAVIEGELADTLRDVRHQVCPSATVALSSALLLPMAKAEAAKQRIPHVAPDVRILVNGPWPPYTFANVRSE